MGALSTMNKTDTLSMGLLGGGNRRDSFLTIQGVPLFRLSLVSVLSEMATGSSAFVFRCDGHSASLPFRNENATLDTAKVLLVMRAFLGD